MLRGLGAITAGAAAAVAAVPAIATAETPDRSALWRLTKPRGRAFSRLRTATNDYEALEKAGRGVDTALDAIMETPPSRSPVRGPPSNTWSSGNKGAQRGLRLPADTAALAAYGRRKEV
jgi:hypothetical protein